MAKIDLKADFRMVPIVAEEWDLLGFHWKGKYYVDTCLPFGLRSAPYIFNQFASALHWIMATNYVSDLIHYLDKFLLAGPPGQPTCSESTETMLRVCEKLGISVALDKLEGPATTITFLGITIDTTLQQLRLPPDKLQEMTLLIKSWLGKHKTTKRDLLSLIGKLSFAVKVVLSGRLFLRQLTELSIPWQELFAIVAAACTWGHLLQGQRITVHCDNMAIVQAWSN